MYQNNIRASNELQTEIIKGVKEGGRVYILFLKAAKAISHMTSENEFYTQIEADIAAIYGSGLLEPEPLRMEFEAAGGRIAKLRAGGKPPAHRCRNQGARGPSGRNTKVPYNRFRKGVIRAGNFRLRKSITRQEQREQQPPRAREIDR
jgi:hypothetical protein